MKGKIIPHQIMTYFVALSAVPNGHPQCGVEEDDDNDEMSARLSMWALAGWRVPSRFHIGRRPFSEFQHHGRLTLSVTMPFVKE